MLDDVSREIKAQLYERARSPLLGTFAVSWSAWNFPAIAIFFSDMGIAEKLQYWENFFRDSWITHGFFYPLSATVLFLIAYPMPARWFFHYWNWQHSKLKAIQQKIEDDTPLTQEEARAIRKGAIEQQLQIQEQLTFLTSSKSDLEKSKSDLLEEVSELRQENQKVLERIASLEESLKSSALEVITLKEKSQKKSGLKSAGPEEGVVEFEVDFENETNRDLSIPPEVIGPLRNQGFNPEEMQIFAILVAEDGKASPRRLKSYKKWNQIEFSHALQSLKQRNLIYYREAGGDSDEIKLSGPGMSLAVESGLTKAMSRL